METMSSSSLLSPPSRSGKRCSIVCDESIGSYCFLDNGFAIVIILKQVGHLLPMLSVDRFSLRVFGISDLFGLAPDSTKMIALSFSFSMSSRVSFSDRGKLISPAGTLMPGILRNCGGIKTMPTMPVGLLSSSVARPASWSWGLSSRSSSCESRSRASPPPRT